MFLQRSVWFAVLAVGVTTVAVAEDPHHKTQDSCAGLEAFKALEGQWVGKEVGDKGK